MLPIALLLVSNVFMTFAWYGHLKHKSAPLLTVILVSWGIAFFEYCFQVPANRLGHGSPGHPGPFNAAQLKTIQEIITLIVFVAFSYFWLGEVPTLKTLAGFALIGAGAFLIFNR